MSVPPLQFEIEWLLEDNPELLVLNKPAGRSLLKDRTGAEDLWSALRARYGKLYPVHRLDKGTSGVLLVARSPSLQKRLTRAFAARRVTKLYWARVLGDFAAPHSGHIDLPLRKGRKSRYRIAGPRDSIVCQGHQWRLDSEPHPDGIEAQTRYRRLSSDGHSTELLLRPRTGRTHQLRVHLSWLGHPILGDRLYGKPEDPAQVDVRLRLHAWQLRVPGLGTWRAPCDARTVRSS